MDRSEQIYITGPERITLLEYQLAGVRRALLENEGNLNGAQADLKIGKGRLKRFLKKIRRPEEHAPDGAPRAMDPVPPDGGKV